MKDIKFRAWDKKEKKMANVISIDFYNYFKKETQVFLQYGNEDFNLRKLEDVELMQYTGMKDANGKDVYEGDICKLSSDSVYLNEYIILDEDWKLITIVEEKDYAYMFKDIEDKYNTIFLCEVYDNDIIVEAVGNIYENPELLEVQE